MKNKNIISILLLIFSLSIGVAQKKCPDAGDGKNDREIRLNKLKNRSCVIFAGDSIASVSIDSILKAGADLTRFSENQIVTVEGYITLIKAGGSESCNCHTKDKELLDIHVEISNKEDAKNTESFICSITPKYYYRDRIKWDSFKGHKVRVTGYMFFNLEHIQNAVNTNPTGKSLSRSTCWELHPVINIELVQ